METNEIMEKLQQIFCKVLKKDAISLAESTTAHDVDGWDSLTNMTLMAEIEKCFGIRFSFREIMRFRNIGDLCRIISDKTKA